MDRNTIEGIDYGPLANLIGSWKGNKGIDIAPDPDGEENNPYYETILFEAIGDVTNAESQNLSALRYHQIVYRKSNDKVFHNETGYWMWDSERNIIMQSLTIPRGVCLLAGGTASSNDNETTINVQAALDNKEWNIIQSPFMTDNAKTTSFKHHISVKGDQLEYSETTMVDIFGKNFEHTDDNTLIRLQD
ncbi:MAG: FABP family protein [Methylococcales bacterium]|jgi:hypothetical protein|nr:FABP family protein [Methylococcales bacterium]MBT7410678.1 FABP family protein [Methylococcales bacterium]